jgi:DNA-binding CsgD family transcriptional regulator
MVSVVTLVSLAAAVSFAWVGWFIYQMDRDASVNRWFALLCLSFACKSASVTAALLASSGGYTDFWERMIYFWACVYNPIGLAFLLSLSGELHGALRKPWIPLVVLGPLVVVQAANLGWGSVGPLHGEPAWYYAHYAVNSALTLLGALLALRWARRTTLRREKFQAYWFFSWTTFGLIAAVAVDFVFDARDLPSPSNFVPLLWVIGIFVSIRRFGLMRLTPSNASEYLMEGIDECVFLIDPALETAEPNRSALALLGIGSQSGTAIPLERIFENADSLRLKLEGLRDSKGSRKGLGVIARGGLGPILLRATFHLVRDQWGDPIGNVAIARPWNSVAALALQYRLSEREQQVLQFILSDAQQKEMADRLCLSLPTIKSHTTSLYNKLGVSSRGEVWSLCAPGES